MNVKMRIFQLSLSLIAIFYFAAASSISAEYEAMQGAESANAVFDFRVADAKSALGHLDLIHTMLKEPNMMIDGGPPEIVVVFIGPSVRLISTDEFGPEQNQQKELDAVAGKIAAMNKDGINFEICMTSAHALNIDPESILPEINKVDNGWISLIGYQHNGYAMIADF
jgi:uncharacterized protein